MKNLIAAPALALTLAFAVPAAAQPTDPGRPSNFILFGLRRLGCEVAIQVIENWVGLGEAARAAAQRWGICPPLESSSGPPPVLLSPTPPPGGLQPGLALSLFEVTGSTSNSLAPARPDTRYAQGEGFVVLLDFNAPGYLEVWSVEGETETFVEAVALNPDGGTTLALPARGSPAFYQFTNAGTDTEYLRLRYYPCRGLSNQSFVITQNTHLAGALNDLGSQGQTLRDSLPSCPLGANDISSTSARAVFGSSVSVPLEWSNADSRYVAVLDRVVHNGRRSMIVDVPLRRGQ